jgi:hypothetical protein
MSEEQTVPKHEHKWQSVVHMDGCHFYTNSYRCTVPGCKVTATTTTERDLALDPYGAMWLRDGSDGDEPCERCKQLSSGEERPVHHVVISEGDTILEEKKETIPAEQPEGEEEGDGDGRDS